MHRRARAHALAEDLRLQPSRFGRGGNVPLQAGDRRRVAVANGPAPSGRGRHRRSCPEPDAGARAPGVRPRRVSPDGQWGQCARATDPCTTVVGRRNWTFAGSDRGGERAAAIYTLIETAKLNGIDPQAWLAAMEASTAAPS